MVYENLINIQPRNEKSLQKFENFQIRIAFILTFENTKMARYLKIADIKMYIHYSNYLIDNIAILLNLNFILFIINTNIYNI
jgi:hypothetical protein